MRVDNDHLHDDHRAVDDGNRAVRNDDDDSANHRTALHAADNDAAVDRPVDNGAGQLDDHDVELADDRARRLDDHHVHTDAHVFTTADDHDHHHDHRPGRADDHDDRSRAAGLAERRADQARSARAA
jgi:hypothetical protein